MIPAPTEKLFGEACRHIAKPQVGTV